MESQVELFDAHSASSSRVVIAIDTDISPFGNRTDLIIVDESTVRGVSLVESDDSDVQYFNHASKIH